MNEESIQNEQRQENAGTFVGFALPMTNTK